MHFVTSRKRIRVFRIKLRKILEIIHAKFTISDGKWVILVMEN